MARGQMSSAGCMVKNISLTQRRSLREMRIRKGQGGRILDEGKKECKNAKGGRGVPATPAGEVGVLRASSGTLLGGTYLVSKG